MASLPSLDEPLPSGPVRSHPLSRRNRASIEGRWEHDRFRDAGARRRDGFARRDGRDGRDEHDGLRSGYRVIVSGMDPRTSETTVQQLFRPYGYVISATLGRNSDTNEYLGVAEVVFAYEGDADRATEELSGSTLNGRILRVERRGKAFISAPQRFDRRGGGDFRRSSSRGGFDRPRDGYNRSSFRPREHRQRRSAPSTSSLDADLDAYMSKD